MPLRINIVKKPNYVYLVELKGSIDTETHQQFEDELAEIIDEKTKAVIVDMAGVDYISSIGIKSLLVTRKALEKVQAEFSMVNLQSQIKKVLDAMKILPMIDIFDDMPEADQYIDQIIKEEINKQAA
jgi:anti-anti-sigma factor